MPHAGVPSETRRSRVSQRTVMTHTIPVTTVAAIPLKTPVDGVVAVAMAPTTRVDIEVTTEKPIPSRANTLPRRESGVARWT